MTNLATSVETQLFVIGILGIKVVIQMAEDTNRRKVFGLAAPVAVGNHWNDEQLVQLMEAYGLTETSETSETPDSSES